MANVNIPDLTALTAPAAADVIEVYDDSAAANKKLALSYVALLGTANEFTAIQKVSSTRLHLAGVSTRMLIEAGDAGQNTSIGIDFNPFNDGPSPRLAILSEAVGSWARGNLHLVVHTAADSGVYTIGTDTRLFISGSTGHVAVGTTTDSGQLTVNGELAIVDGMTAPSTTSGWAKIYVDSADGDLKIKFGDGTVKTIVVDT